MSTCSRISVLDISILPFYKILILNFRTILTLWYFVFFILFWISNDRFFTFFNLAYFICFQAVQIMVKYRAAISMRSSHIAYTQYVFRISCYLQDGLNLSKKNWQRKINGWNSLFKKEFWIEIQFNSAQN